MPRSVAAATSTLSTPAPVREMILSFGAAAMTSRVTAEVVRRMIP